MSIIGVIKGDTRNLDYGAYESAGILSATRLGFHRT